MIISKDMERRVGREKPKEKAEKKPAAAKGDAKAKAKGKAKAKAGIMSYKGCTIYTSDSKQGYRVLMPGEDRVDTCFKWNKYGGKAAALKAVHVAIDKAL